MDGSPESLPPGVLCRPPLCPTDEKETGLSDTLSEANYSTIRGNLGEPIECHHWSLQFAQMFTLTFWTKTKKVSWNGLTSHKNFNQ